MSDVEQLRTYSQHNNHTLKSSNSNFQHLNSTIQNNNENKPYSLYNALGKSSDSPFLLNQGKHYWALHWEWKSLLLTSLLRSLSLHSSLVTALRVLSKKRVLLYLEDRIVAVWQKLFTDFSIKYNV